jgi:hypothetical protein
MTQKFDPNHPPAVDPMMMTEQGHLVALPPAKPGDPIVWVQYMSEQGMKIQEAIHSSGRCPDPTTLKPCLP